MSERQIKHVFAERFKRKTASKRGRVARLIAWRGRSSSLHLAVRAALVAAAKPVARLAKSVGDGARGRGWRGGDYFRLAATFGKGAVTSRSSTAMMPSSVRDTHRPTCQNIATCSPRSTLFWSLFDDARCFERRFDSLFNRSSALTIDALPTAWSYTLNPPIFKLYERNNSGFFKYQ